MYFWGLEVIVYVVWFMKKGKEGKKGGVLGSERVGLWLCGREGGGRGVKRYGFRFFSGLRRRKGWRVGRGGDQGDLWGKEI